MQRHDFDGDSAISESESQTRHLTNSQNSVDFLARLENKMLVCCGPRLGKIFLTHKAMWICIVLSIIYYAIGIAYYASVEKWTLVTNIYFITISFLSIGYGFIVPGSDGARVFTAFYASGGIVLIAFTLNNICRSWLSANINACVDYVSPSSNLDEKYLKHLIAGVMIIFMFFFIGLIYFSSVEYWTSAQVFYFVVTTMVTVGYGDFAPTTDGSRIFLMAWMYWCMTAYYHTLNNVVNSFDVVKAGLISRMNSMREIELGDTVAPPPTTTSSFTTTAASIRREKKTKESFNNNNNNNTNDTFGISGGVDATGRTGTGATGYSVNSDTGSVTSQSFSSNDARNAYVIDQLVKRGIIDSSTLEPIENDFNGR